MTKEPQPGDVAHFDVHGNIYWEKLTPLERVQAQKENKKSGQKRKYTL